MSGSFRLPPVMAPTLLQSRTPLASRGAAKVPLEKASTNLESANGYVPPQRLLATAYDQNWMLKREIPKDTIPARRSRSATGLVKNSKKISMGEGWCNQKKKISMAKAHLGFTRPSTTGTDFRRNSWSSPAGSNQGQLSPTSAMAKTFMTRALVQGGSRRRSTSLPSLAALPAVPRLSTSGSDGCKRPPTASSDGSAEKEAAAEQSDEEEREEMPLGRWAQEAQVPYDIALQCLDTFLDFVSNPPPEKFKIEKNMIVLGMPFDAGVDLGSMDTEAFGNACLEIADCKDFSSMPPGFLDQAMTDADKDGSGDIDFGEFLYFYYKFSFSEEIIIGNAERKLRSAAREHNIAYDEIGKYKYIFDQTDTNRNGRIDFEEFKILVAKLLKVPRGEKVPEKRAKDMWKEVCRTGAKGCLHDLDFYTFVGWYKRYFMGDTLYDESPFEAYYHNIRRVSLYDSNAFH